MRRHELDRLSLVAGLVFLALAAGVMAEAPVVAVLRHTRWLLPGFGILLGLGLLSSALRGERDAEGEVRSDDDPSPSA